MVSADDDFLDSLRKIKGIDLASFSEALVEGRMTRDSYWSFALILEMIVEKSFGKDSGFGYLLPRSYFIGDREYSPSYPSLIVKPLKENQVPKTKKVIEFEKKMYEPMAQIGFPNFPTNGDLLLVLPHHVKAARLYKRNYEMLFGFESELRIVQEHELNNPSATISHDFDEIILPKSKSLYFSPFD